MIGSLVQALDRTIAALLAVFKWLALPIAMLLFLQWPLRDIVGLWSREANDLGQWLFALYVAASITAATRAGTHLSSDAISRHYTPAARHLIARLATFVGVMPWAAFVLWSGRQAIWSSLLAVEKFPDTNNPGYFVIKLALGLLAGLFLLQGVVDLARPLTVSSTPSAAPP